MKHKISIHYCPKCQWMMRAAWLAQELLVTFEDEIEEVALRPSEISGKFCLMVANKEIFDRKEHGGFAEPKYLKQLLRDHIAPDKSLGHSDSSL